MKTSFQKLKTTYNLLPFCSNAEGLDDEYDEEDDIMPQQQEQTVQSRQLNDGPNPLLEIFNAVSNILLRSVTKAAQQSGSQLIRLDRNGGLKGDAGDDDDDGEDVTESAYGNYKLFLYEVVTKSTHDKYKRELNSQG